MKQLNRVKESIVRMFVGNQQEFRSIKSIEVKSICEPVYNFTTSTHTYCLANGAVVHNCDTISMLAEMSPWKPSADIPSHINEEGGDKYWEIEEPENQSNLSSYIV